MGLKVECGVLRGNTVTVVLLSTGLLLTSLNAVYVTIQLLRENIPIRPDVIFKLKFSAYASLVFLGLSIGLIIAGHIVSRLGLKSAIALGQVVNAVSYIATCGNGDLAFAISRFMAGVSLGLQLTPYIVQLGLMLREPESLLHFTALHVIPFIALTIIHVRMPTVLLAIASILISAAIMAWVKEFITLKPPTTIRAYEPKNHLLALLPATPLALLTCVSAHHIIHGDMSWVIMSLIPFALYPVLKGRANVEFLYALTAYAGYGLAAIDHVVLAAFPLMTSFITALHGFSTRMLFMMSPLYTYIAITSSLSLTALYSAFLSITIANATFISPIAPYVTSAFLTAIALHTSRSKIWPLKGARQSK